MRIPDRRYRGTCLLLTALAVFSLAQVCRAASPHGNAAEGKQLFEQKFAAAIPGASTGGDGLGPLFNNVSCAACHLQGGLGGGGPVDVNVVILSAGLRGTRPEKKKLVEMLREVHPSLVSADDEISSSIILHRFSSDWRYRELLAKFIKQPIPLTPTDQERHALQQTLARAAQQNVNVPSPLVMVTSQRNTTALFGAGLIDLVPDAMLHALAEQQARQGEVTGRVPPIGLEGVGRFGWRGQIEHLHDFVLGACAVELGLQVPGHDQPRDPQRPNYIPTSLDLTASQCASLTAYVSSLPAPKLMPPSSPERRQTVERGRELFTTVGCAACHVERIGPVQGIYSDMLLHEMGEALADPLGAEATLMATGKRLPPTDELVLGASNSKSESVRQQLTSVTPRPPRSREYYGNSQNSPLVAAPPNVLIVDPVSQERVEFKPVASQTDTEWRTPPLWGVADSAPYLHDGRAASLVEAIALHGGEAEACTRRYFALTVADRVAVLEFLSCLKAPQ